MAKGEQEAHLGVSVGHPILYRRRIAQYGGGRTLTSVNTLSTVKNPGEKGANDR